MTYRLYIMTLTRRLSSHLWPSLGIFSTLDKEDRPPEDAERMKRLQALLAAPEFRDRPYGSPEELETIIDHNRA